VKKKFRKEGTAASVTEELMALWVRGTKRRVQLFEGESAAMEGGAKKGTSWLRKTKELRNVEKGEKESAAQDLKSYP